MSLKLVYFKMRVLTEAPQMLMHCNNIHYQYLMYWEHYSDEWANMKSRLAFKQLPMLQVDGKHEIWQSIAILKFLENLAGLSVSDPIHEAKANAIQRPQD
jgi:hypothetical protein